MGVGSGWAWWVFVHPDFGKPNLCIESLIDIILGFPIYCLPSQIINASDASDIEAAQSPLLYRRSWLLSLGTPEQNFSGLSQMIYDIFTDCKVASKNTCYYSGNRKFRTLKSRLLTCRILISFRNKTFLFVKI